MKIRQSDEITVVLTDFGLGDMSVAADLAARMSSSGFFPQSTHSVFQLPADVEPRV